MTRASGSQSELEPSLDLFLQGADTPSSATPPDHLERPGDASHASLEPPPLPFLLARTRRAPTQSCRAGCPWSEPPTDTQQQHEAARAIGPHRHGSLFCHHHRPQPPPSSRRPGHDSSIDLDIHPAAMPGKTPQSNGNEPVENGVRNNTDVDMKDAKNKGKKGAKDGDDEMTVVVPPSKASKQPHKSQDGDGDVSMAEGDAADGGEVKVDPVVQTVTDIKSNFALLDRAVALFDARFSLRALRSISVIRKRLTPDIIGQAIVDTFPATVTSGNIAKNLLIAIGRESMPLGRQPGPEMEVDSDNKPAKNGTKKEVKDIIPEIDIFLGILIQVYLFDSKDYTKGAEFSHYLSERIQALNRRTLDSLSAKVYFYYSLFCEHIAPLPPSPESPIVALRPTLLAALRTAVLRKDIDTQASVIVLLLRNYLLTSHISQADLLVSHTQFPENAVNNQVARFLYYLGRIRAIQLRYTEAHEHLTAATRKAPSSNCAVGFSQTATKLLMVVELLMGDIPDRATFRLPSLEDALHPYFLLVQAVRVGNLEDFEIAIADHADTFRRDGTYSLILRLRQNVIKTGIRMMSLSYSRISLRDICIRLHLGSEESAEYIVAKAIRDGVIEATLDRERGFMKSKEVGDVYATREPGEAFHDRIQACLALHDESVKAMRFPMNQHRLELKNAQEAREREREMAKEIQEGDLDEDDLGGDFEGM
ncbi:26S proteasome non-ATPase regulatory subunit 3 [Purpureocillium lavendulum]|uniref:26S proteasome non-ATPase regulatory subunit 3 n=1 Tax=Purpureocillium lavendulum TaxID=1247861 RepID=A0AB34FPB4_9HYPO|nr:26S proteasome non-ATPase regulatory subunit 3 [Purpureocillium lavendulum]